MNAEQMRLAKLELALRQARTNMLSFMQWVWWMPSTSPFIIGRHTKAICDRLTRAIEDFRNGKSTYLLIDVPFRHGKSDIVSRALPAFFLGRNADMMPSVIMSGYGDDLVSGFSKDCKNIMTSDAYQTLFPDVRPDPKDNSINSWRVKGSKRIVSVAGITGGITGKGGNLIVLDDYCKTRAQAESKSERDKVWNEFANSVFTRQDPPAAIIVVCATPWHIDDVRGRILKAMKEDPKFPIFEELSFPARKEGVNGWEYLCPELHPPEWYDGNRAVLGPADAAALLDCNPVSKAGCMFKRDWFMTYDIRRQPKINTMNRYIFVDTASEKKKGSDDSVMWVVGLGQDRN